jgi:hypothetical protein
MKFKILLSITVVSLLLCTPKINIHWDVKIPDDKVRFMFLPASESLFNNGLAINDCEIEITFDKRYRRWEESFALYFYHQFVAEKGEMVTFRKKLPDFQIIRQIFTSELDKLPKNIYKPVGNVINYDSLSHFFSKRITEELFKLQDICIKENVNLVVIPLCDIRKIPNKREYRLSIKALLCKTEEDTI